MTWNGRMFSARPRRAEVGAVRPRRRSVRTWSYLFCSESVIKASHGNWDSLVVAAGAI